VLYFIVFLGVLIFIHEFGHFIVARLLGVTVTRFSLGFGPKLIGFKKGETEYWLSALPLGGYVKFLGDDPQEVPLVVNRKKAFLTTDIWRRALIAFAGPLANLLLPFALFLLIYLSHTQVVPSVLGFLDQNGAGYKAGLRPGDKVLSIDDQPVHYWWQLLEKVSSSPSRPLKFKVSRAGKEVELVVTPEPTEIKDKASVGISKVVGRIQVVPERHAPVVTVKRGSIAETAGIKDFDAILKVGDITTNTFEDVTSAVKDSSSKYIPVLVGAVNDDGSVQDIRAVALGPLTPDSDTGLQSAQNIVYDVEEGSPAQRAGIHPKDRVVAVDEKPLSDLVFLDIAFRNDPDRPHTLTIEREEGKTNVTLSIVNPEWAPGLALPRYLGHGIKYKAAVIEPDLVENRHLLAYSILKTWESVKDVVAVTAAGLFGLVAGRVSVKELGGPIMIYDVASKAGEAGFEPFLTAMAWLSVGLAFINLLPIPALDGGHLLLFAIEALTRRPLSKRTREAVHYVGYAFLIALMILAFANDIQRKLGSFY